MAIISLVTPVELAGVARAADPLGNHPSHVGGSHIPDQDQSIDLLCIAESAKYRVFF